MSPVQEQQILTLFIEAQVKQRAAQEAVDALDLAIFQAGNPKFKIKLVEEKPPEPKTATVEEKTPEPMIADLLDGNHASNFAEAQPEPVVEEKPPTPTPQTEEANGSKQ